MKPAALIEQIEDESRDSGLAVLTQASGAIALVIKALRLLEQVELRGLRVVGDNRPKE